VLGRDIDDVLDARDALGTDAVASGLEAASRRSDDGSGGIPSFGLDVRARSGDRLWINVTTAVFDDSRTGCRLFVRLARDITRRRHTKVLLTRMLEVAPQLVSINHDGSNHSAVEALSTQEQRILTLFAQGGNPAAIARQLKISPHTLRNHLHHVNRKLRTHNRLEAVTHAQQHGIIE
jgi:DNA-binding CsgD family transcriptional regulator